MGWCGTMREGVTGETGGGEKLASGKVNGI